MPAITMPKTTMIWPISNLVGVMMGLRPDDDRPLRLMPRKISQTGIRENYGCDAPRCAETQSSGEIENYPLYERLVPVHCRRGVGREMFRAQREHSAATRSKSVVRS